MNWNTTNQFIDLVNLQNQMMDTARGAKESAMLMRGYSLNPTQGECRELGRAHGLLIAANMLDEQIRKLLR